MEGLGGGGVNKEEKKEDEADDVISDYFSVDYVFDIMFMRRYPSK
jgi:hypothetical protein